MKILLTILLLYTQLCFSQIQSAYNPLFLTKSNPAHLKSVYKHKNLYVLRKYNTFHRFDGNTWSNFSCTFNMQVLDFEITRDGNLLIASEHGLFITDTVFQNQTKNILYFKINNLPVLDSVYFIKEINGTIYTASNNGITSYNGLFAQNIKINNRYVVDLLEDDKQNLMIATNSGLLKFKNGILSVFDSVTSILPSGKLSQLHKTNNNEIFFKVNNPTINQGIYVWKNQSIQSVPVNNCTKLPTDILYITSDNHSNVYFMYNQSSQFNVGNELYFGRSLYQLNRKNNKLNAITYPTSIYSAITHEGQLVLVKQDSICGYDLDFVEKQFADSLTKYEGFTERLDANNLSTVFLSSADFGWDLNYSNNSNYSYFPKSTCNTNFLAGAIWLTDSVDDVLYCSAQTLRQKGNDFFPGPINKKNGIIQSHPFQSNLKNQYSKPFKITKLEIDYFKQNYLNGFTAPIPESILTWPAHGDTALGQLYNLAPFIDVDADGFYNPYFGDYPDIKGDMAIFIVFNDAFEHSETQGTPFNFQFNVMAYSYACSDINENSNDEAINNTLFINYKIINRSDINYNNIKLGMWLSLMIGNYTDDRAGSNPELGFGYGYNGYAYDSTFSGYDINWHGNRPATIAVLPLGPDSNHAYLDGFITHDATFSNQGFPYRAQDYANYLNFRFKDNTHLSYGGSGYDANNQNYTTYQFPGSKDVLKRPVWYDRDTLNRNQNKYMLSVIPPLSLRAGADTSITFAIVSSLPTDSATTITKIESDVRNVKKWFAQNSFPGCGKLIIPTATQEKTPTQAHVKIYPNPAKETIKISVENCTKNVLRIHNIEGKMVFEKFNIECNQPVDLSGISPGFYFVEFSTPQQTYFQKLVKE